MLNKGVYIAHAVGTDRYKIGWSVDVCSRISHLQTGCPYLIEVLGVIDTEQDVEKQLHILWGEYQVQGEWFCLDSQQLTGLLSTTEKDLTRISSADFLLGKVLTGYLSASKIEDVRTASMEIRSGIGL